MSEIGSVLKAMNLPVSQDAPPPAARPRMNDRMWPADLKALLDNPKAVGLLVDGTPTSCPNCGGAGLMMVYVWSRGPFQQPVGKCKVLDIAEGRGWYSGETVYSPCPVCQEDGWREYLRTNCGLKGTDTNTTLGTFRISGSCEEKADALQVARGLLAMNTSPHGFVTLHGEPGRGKSHLMKALVNGFCGIRIYARYINAADLISEIRDQFGDDRGGLAVEEAIRHYRHIKVLAIDELDKVNMTAWAEQTMHRLLDARYNDMDGLLTILAMNKAPEDLPAGFDYLVSRMSGGIKVKVAGPDMRGFQGMQSRMDIGG